MIPVDFNEATHSFGPPTGESQVLTIRAHVGRVRGGSYDGAPMIVTAWLPTEPELEALKQGSPIFLTVFCNGLPPHMLTTNFQDATHPT